jgi:hypothetical protein
MELNTDQIIKLLNKLGPLYHSYFGIYPEKNTNFVEKLIYYDNDRIKQQIVDAINCNNKIITEDSQFITDIKYFDNPNSLNKHYWILYNYTKLINDLNKEIPFTTVTIKYQNKNYWDKLPNEWYNQQSQNWKNTDPYLKSYILPYIEDIEYITIDDLFLQVSISSIKKESRLTIEDILLATRSLIIDDNRSIDSGYTLLNFDDNTLVIEPNIYNK